MAAILTVAAIAENATDAEMAAVENWQKVAAIAAVAAAAKCL